MFTAEGELYVGGRRAIKSKEDARKLFTEFHSPNGGHMGILKTRAAMSSRFYWLGMTVDINNWVGYAFELLLCSVFCVLLTTTFLKVLECDKCQKVGKPLTAAKQLQCIQVHMYSGILLLSNSHQ